MNSTLALISGLGLVLGLQALGLGLQAFGLGLGLETPGLVNIPAYDIRTYYSNCCQLQRSRVQECPCALVL